ncbi:Protein archease [Fukomys damarensis]|uniref:Protein archease n=1 Tax=Fukomys damarensis TaxID=885580 RepID=A0A091E6H2_FUKDA|nr:Protein archease [Fukomys damarensis]
MLQEEEDVRDCSLTEDQKVLRTKYTPVFQKYEHLDCSANVYAHGEKLCRECSSSVPATFSCMRDTEMTDTVFCFTFWVNGFVSLVLMNSS